MYQTAHSNRLNTNKYRKMKEIKSKYLVPPTFELSAQVLGYGIVKTTKIK